MTSRKPILYRFKPTEIAPQLSVLGFSDDENLDSEGVEEVSYFLHSKATDRLMNVLRDSGLISDNVAAAMIETYRDMTEVEVRHLKVHGSNFLNADLGALNDTWVVVGKNGVEALRLRAAPPPTCKTPLAQLSNFFRGTP